jgi:predicted nucleotidyltransferase component of viral defense system
MNDLVKARLKSYNSKTSPQEKDALREIIQEITLLGLWRGKFFEHAAFYGGIALRILYQLDRFSEDLDFTALSKTDGNVLSGYIHAVESELQAYGFDVKVERKLKSAEATTDSAFVKADTELHLLAIDSIFQGQKGETLKVKFEIDTDPAKGFTTEAKPFFWPQVFSVLTCDLPSLFAGKLHATFCRRRVNNIKGRDWYDFLWYVARGIKPNYLYLENKLRQSGNWSVSSEFTPDAFKEWAKDQLTNFDVEGAKNDIRRFIKDPRSLDGWSKDAFRAAIDRL